MEQSGEDRLRDGLKPSGRGQTPRLKRCNFSKDVHARGLAPSRPARSEPYAALRLVAISDSSRTSQRTPARRAPGVAQSAL